MYIPATNSTKPVNRTHLFGIAANSAAPNITTWKTSSLPVRLCHQLVCTHKHGGQTIGHRGEYGRHKRN